MDLATQLFVISGSEPSSSFLELREKVPRGMRQLFFPIGDLGGIERAITAASSDIYIGAAPRVRQRGTAADVERAWCAWADIDTEDAYFALAAFPVAPTLTIASGRGVHAWWAMPEPLAPAEAVALNRRLVAALGSDRAATDVARILRPVGSLNWKTSPPIRVHVTATGDQTTFAELDAVLPRQKAPERRPEPRRARLSDAEDPLKAIPAEEYIAVLAPDVELIRGQAICPFHADTDPSFRVYGTGWTCFGGCEPLDPVKQHLGGDIYTFAALIWGVSPRPRGLVFSQLTKELERLFLEPDLRTT